MQNPNSSDYLFLQDVLSVIKREFNKNFQFSRFLVQCVKNGNTRIYVQVRVLNTYNIIITKS